MSSILATVKTDVSVEIDSAEMAQILNAEFDRLSNRFDLSGYTKIEQSVGDLVRLTGMDMEQFGFPAVKGQLAKVTGIISHGRVGVLITLGPDGEFLENRFRASQVETVSGVPRTRLN